MTLTKKLQKAVGIGALALVPFLNGCSGRDHTKNLDTSTIVGVPNCVYLPRDFNKDGNLEGFQVSCYKDKNKFPVRELKMNPEEMYECYVTAEKDGSHAYMSCTRQKDLDINY